MYRPMQYAVEEGALQNRGISEEKNKVHVASLFVKKLPFNSKDPIDNSSF